MNIVDLVRIVWRWWWLTAIMAVLTLGAATAVLLTSAPAYELAVPLLMEPAGTQDEGGVPLASVLAGALASGEIRAEITDEGGTGLYSVEADDAGVITITAITNDGSVALDSVAQVQERAQTVLEDVATGYGVDPADVDLRIVSTPGIRGVTEEDLPIAAGSLLLIEPMPPSNPYESGDYSAQILLTSLQSALAAEDVVVEEGVEITTDQEFRDPAPVIDITVTGPTPEAIVDLATQIRDYTSEELQRLQADLGVPEPLRTRVVTLRDVTQPEEIPASPLRATIAVLLLGGVATIAVVVAADAVSIIRRRKREDADAAMVRLRTGEGRGADGASSTSEGARTRAPSVVGAAGAAGAGAAAAAAARTGAEPRSDDPTTGNGAGTSADRYEARRQDFVRTIRSADPSDQQPGDEAPVDERESMQRSDDDWGSLPDEGLAAAHEDVLDDWESVDHRAAEGADDGDADPALDVDPLAPLEDEDWDVVRDVEPVAALEDDWDVVDDVEPVASLDDWDDDADDVAAVEEYDEPVAAVDEDDEPVAAVDEDEESFDTLAEDDEPVDALAEDDDEPVAAVDEDDDVDGEPVAAVAGDDDWHEAESVDEARADDEPVAAVDEDDDWGDEPVAAVDEHDEPVDAFDEDDALAEDDEPVDALDEDDDHDALAEDDDWDDEPVDVLDEDEPDADGDDAADDEDEEYAGHGTGRRRYESRERNGHRVRQRTRSGDR